MSFKVNVSFLGKLISKLFRFNPLAISFAASSGFIMNGILKLFLSVKGVLTKPGDISFMSIFSFASV